MKLELGLGDFGCGWKPATRTGTDAAQSTTKTTNKRSHPTNASNPTQLPSLLPFKRQEQLPHDRLQQSSEFTSPSSFETLPRLPEKNKKKRKKSKQTTFRLAPTTKKTPYHPPANRMMISRVRLANLLGSSAPSTRKNVCVFHSIMSVFRIAYIAYNSLHHQLQPLATRNPQGSAGRVQEARAQKGADAPAR